MYTYIFHYFLRVINKRKLKKIKNKLKLHPLIKKIKNKKNPLHDVINDC